LSAQILRVIYEKLWWVLALFQEFCKKEKLKNPYRGFMQNGSNPPHPPHKCGEMNKTHVCQAILAPSRQKPKIERNEV
jgi:hypothetical protein